MGRCDNGEEGCREEEQRCSCERCGGNHPSVEAGVRVGACAMTLPGVAATASALSHVSFCVGGIIKVSFTSTLFHATVLETLLSNNYNGLYSSLTSSPPPPASPASSPSAADSHPTSARSSCSPPAQSAPWEAFSCDSAYPAIAAP